MPRRYARQPDEYSSQADSLLRYPFPVSIHRTLRTSLSHTFRLTLAFEKNKWGESCILIWDHKVFVDCRPAGGSEKLCKQFAIFSAEISRGPKPCAQRWTGVTPHCPFIFLSFECRIYAV